MIKCPYCQGTMKKGFIEAEGKWGLLWVDENKKRSLSSKLNNSDCIILDGDKVLNKCRVAANYCDNCKKIIVDVNSNYIFL